MDEVLKFRLKDVKLLLLDADGVLTTGEILYGPGGMQLKAFDVKDGLGIKLLLKNQVQVAIISIKDSQALFERARDLGIEHVIMGRQNKAWAAKELIERLGIDPSEVCAVGDDLPDLGLFSMAGIRIAVNDAVEEIRQEADIITHSKGGRGAVREVSELILKAKGLWAKSLQEFKSLALKAQ